MSALPTVLLWLLGLLCATAFGSFANVLVYRLPLQILRSEAALQETDSTFNIAVPASHCPSCQTPLKWRHNIPLLSFVFLKGRCAFCHAVIPARYFWIELGTIALAYACLWLWGVNAAALMVFAVLYVLWVLIWIDALYRLLPDVLTLGLLWAGLLVRASLAPASLADAVLGAALGYVLLWLPYAVYLQWRGEVGLGLGDAKLLAAIGAWLGVLVVPYVLLLGSVLGLIYGVAQFACRRLRAGERQRLGGVQIAFGPFIIVAAIAVALWNHAEVWAGWRWM